MVAKRGQKRKASGDPFVAGIDDLTPPDRETWTGWVEMESEPAFFNVMLKEMGVSGVKVQEVLSLDTDMLAILPQPVYALIFLFRYRAEDEMTNSADHCPSHIWFANQIPDFACATVALLNIINNIPDLEMSNEMIAFKQATQYMSPMNRGDAIDGFEYVRKIHNSFATESDMLNADMHLKEKMEKFKRSHATAKANATKATKKAAKKAKSAGQNETAGSPVASKGSAKVETPSSSNSTDFEGASEESYDDHSRVVTRQESATQIAVRKSTRERKPRQGMVNTEDEEPGEPAFHFVAYMPIEGSVWRMDGLDYFPHDIGSSTCGDMKSAMNNGTGGTVSSDWLGVVRPSLLDRMSQFEGADIDISYNLMAVVHDPFVNERRELLENIKAIQKIDTKIDGTAKGWQEVHGAETRRNAFLPTAPELGITQADVDASEVDPGMKDKIASQNNVLDLITLRDDIVAQQTYLWAAIRDAKAAEKGDEVQVRHQRHDYATFVRNWLGALAEHHVLADLIDT